MNPDIGILSGLSQPDWNAIAIAKNNEGLNHILRLHLQSRRLNRFHTSVVYQNVETAHSIPSLFNKSLNHLRNSNVGPNRKPTYPYRKVFVIPSGAKHIQADAGSSFCECPRDASANAPVGSSHDSAFAIQQFAKSCHRVQYPH